MVAEESNSRILGVNIGYRKLDLMTSLCDTAYMTHMTQQGTHSELSEPWGFVRSAAWLIAVPFVLVACVSLAAAALIGGRDIEAMMDEWGMP